MISGSGFQALFIKELRALFYTPVGWIVLVVFCVQTALAFAANLESQFLLDASGSSVARLTERLLTWNVGLYRDVLDRLYLLVPLITMGIVSRELQSGTHEFLLSCPVQVGVLIAAKYVALVTYFVSLVLFVALIVGACGLFVIDQTDWGAALFGLTSIFAMLSIYGAVGLFISSCTRYPIVAGVVTLAVLFILSNLHAWFAGVQVAETVAQWVSVSARSNRMRAGLFDSADVVYVAIVVTTLLVLTTDKVSMLRNRRPIKKYAGRLAVIFLCGAVGAWVSTLSQFRHFADFTRFQLHTPSVETQALLTRLKGKVEVSTFGNILMFDGSYATPKFRMRDSTRFDLYRRYKPEMANSYTMYHSAGQRLSQRTSRLSDLSEAESLKIACEVIDVDCRSVLSPTSLREIEGIDAEAEDYRSFRILRWREQEAPIRFFDDPRRIAQESEISAAIKRVVSGAAVIGFTDGNGERRFDRLGGSDYERAFARLSYRFALVNHGFDVETVSLSDGVPEHIDVLVVADPRQPFDSIQLDSLKAYIQEGGNLLLAIDTDTTSSIDNILEYVGFHRGPVIQQQHDDLPQSLVLASYVTEHGLSIQDYLQDPSPVAMPGSVALYPSSSADLFEQAPILVASRTTTNPVAGSSERRKPSLTSSTVGYALQRKLANQTQRLLIFGDADFLSNGEIERTSPSTSNRSLPSNLLYFLSDTKFPVKMSRPTAHDRRFLIDRETKNSISLAFSFVVPTLIALLGASLILRRRSRSRWLDRIRKSDQGMRISRNPR